MFRCAHCECSRRLSLSPSSATQDHRLCSPTLCLSFPRLIHPITGHLYLTLHLHPFAQPSLMPPATTSLFSDLRVPFCLFFCICFEIIQYLSFSDGFHLALYSVATNGKAPLFYGWVILHCICMHTTYLSIYQFFPTCRFDLIYMTNFFLPLLNIIDRVILVAGVRYVDSAIPFISQYSLR